MFPKNICINTYQQQLDHRKIDHFVNYHHLDNILIVLLIIYDYPCSYFMYMMIVVIEIYYQYIYIFDNIV
jgi:hypothetical protein